MNKTEKIKFKFFDIKNFGYHNFDNESYFPKHHVILDELHLWAKSQGTLINTSCYERRESENIYGTYFYDHIKFNNDDDGLLILWDETENSDGGVFSINQFAVPGQGKIEKKTFGDNNIPGRPSYFWINFPKRIIASIKLETSSSKKTNIERYLHGFLKNHTKYKVSNSSGDEIKTINYLDPNAKSELLHTSYPLVNFSSKKNFNIRNEVLLRYREIRKLISKEDLIWKKIDHREKIEKFFCSIFTQPLSLSGKKTFKQEISFQPTLKQVKEIINNFENNLTDKTIIDIGFKLKDQTVLMLSGMHLSKEFTAEIIYKDDGFASTQSLLGEINKRKSEFLSQMEELPIIEIDESYFIEESDNLDLFENAS